MAVSGHPLENMMAVVKGRRHQLRRLVDREAEHDSLVARALILVLRRVDALGDMRRLAMKVILEAGGLPVEARLFVADPLHGVADDLFDLITRAGRPAVRVLEPFLVIDWWATDLAANHDPLSCDQRLAGDARFGVMADEIVHQSVADLICDLVGMALGNGFGGEEVGVAHGLAEVLASLGRLGRNLI
jgi:hypothetical protein